MDCLTLFFAGLSAIATLGLLICTIIGFIYIRKQIKIAKNKDILFSLQNEITKLTYLYHTSYHDLYSKFHNLVYDYNEYGITPAHQESIEDNIYNIIYKHEFKPLKSYALSTDFYFWWLGKNNFDKLLEIKKSKQYTSLREYYKPFKSLANLLITKRLNENDLKNTIDDFVKNYNDVVKEFQKFLAELAREKGVS